MFQVLKLIVSNDLIHPCKEYEIRIPTLLLLTLPNLPMYFPYVFFLIITMYFITKTKLNIYFMLPLMNYDCYAIFIMYYRVNLSNTKQPILSLVIYTLTLTYLTVNFELCLFNVKQPTTRISFLSLCKMGPKYAILSSNERIRYLRSADKRNFKLKKYRYLWH